MGIDWHFYKNFELKMRDEEDILEEKIDKKKLMEHYKNLLDTILE